MINKLRFLINFKWSLLRKNLILRCSVTKLLDARKVGLRLYTIKKIFPVSISKWKILQPAEKYFSSSREVIRAMEQQYA